MLTWTVVSFPAPAGDTYTFGIVNATDEATARAMVLSYLESQGVNIVGIDPLEIGLVPWPTDTSYLKLVWG